MCTRRARVQRTSAGEAPSCRDTAGGALALLGLLGWAALHVNLWGSVVLEACVRVAYRVHRPVWVGRTP